MPTTSCPASCRRPATALLSTPPDMATTMRILAVHHVPAARRKSHDQPVERLGHDDLAAKPRGLLEPEGEIEHVLLVLRRFRQLGEPRRIDDDVTSGASKRALARALDIHTVLVRHLQNGKAERRLDFATGAVALDEGHAWHGRSGIGRSTSI